MARKGPTPERSDLRIRRNKPEDGITLTKGTARGFSSWPRPGELWSPEVTRFYNSFKSNGMSDYFEATDVEMVWQLCDELDHHRRREKRSAVYLDTIMKHLAALGATEDGRRRMRIELESPATGTEFDSEYELAELLMQNPLITGE